MRTTPTGGLTVWDLNADQFDHDELATNWDIIDSFWTGFDTTSKLPKRIHTTATVPVTGTAGDVVMLTADNGGYRNYTLLRYDGSNWRPANSMEIQPSVPTSGNFAGRVVILSASSGGFDAWNIIRYDGSAWELIGGWRSINNGAGALNIKGVQQTLDAFISDSARGFVLKDRVTGTNYRLYFTNGNLAFEAVT